MALVNNIKSAAVLPLNLEIREWLVISEGIACPKLIVIVPCSAWWAAFLEQCSFIAEHALACEDK